jgi:hypothetical protein
MSIKKQRLVPSHEFLEVVDDPKALAQLCQEPFIVQGYVNIGPDQFKGDSLSIQNAAFSDLLTLGRGLSMRSVSIRETNFMKGCIIEGAKAGYVHIASVDTDYLNIWGCEGEFALLEDLKVAGRLDVSGFKLSKELRLSRVTYERLDLINANTSCAIRTPWVRTDDTVAAVQLRLANIPVFMSTEAVRADLQGARRLAMAS